MLKSSWKGCQCEVDSDDHHPSLADDDDVGDDDDDGKEVLA